MTLQPSDFHALSILNAVIESRCVKTTAKKMAISPSSVTYAIHKIRKSVSDPLFNRTEKGIVPTALALELNRQYTRVAALMAGDISSQ